MSITGDNRRSAVLFFSLLLLLLSNPLLESNETGRGIMMAFIFLTLVASAVELSGAKRWQWPVLLLMGASMTVGTISYLEPDRPMQIAAWVLLAGFFGLVSGLLFLHLGQAGPVTTGRLLVSVSLYLLIAMFWFTLYSLMEVIHPGSFAQQAGCTLGPRPRNALLYMSLATQTTLGYGDVLPQTPMARMMAALQSAAGVLYIAITVARLVAAYEASNRQKI